MTNPYHAPRSVDATATSKRRWIRNLLVLNTVLILLPVGFVIIGYVALIIALRAANVSVYDTQFTGFSGGSIGTLLGYFLVPNSLLIAWMLLAGRSTSDRSV